MPVALPVAPPGPGMGSMDVGGGSGRDRPRDGGGGTPPPVRHARLVEEKSVEWAVVWDGKPVYVYLDVSIGGRAPGRVVLRLRPDVVPRTAENFRLLCTGERGFGFKGTPFHRIEPTLWAQSGDWEFKNGTGGRSVYGLHFKDESHKLKHTGRGVVSMVVSRPNTSNSQFMIALDKTEWLDDLQVVFGEVVAGMEVVDAIEAAGTADGTPTVPVIIADCGQTEKPVPKPVPPPPPPPAPAAPPPPPRPPRVA